MEGSRCRERRRRLLQEADRPGVKEIARADNSGYDRRPLERAGLLSNDFATIASYRKLGNFSKSRPETTNLNHRYIIRRAFICSLLEAAQHHHGYHGERPRNEMSI